MTVLDVLDELDRRGVDVQAVTINRKLTLRTDAPRGAISDELAAALRQHRDMVVNTILGRATGHAPAPCTTCGEVSFVAIARPSGGRRKTWPKCRFRPACGGRHVPRDADLDRTRPKPPPAQARAPRRPSKQRQVEPHAGVARHHTESTSPDQPPLF